MFDPSKVADEVFEILRTFNYEVAAFDEEGNRVYEPESARRFFTDKRNITVSLTVNGENSSLSLLVGQSVPLPAIQGLNDTLRKAANKVGLNYEIEKYHKDFAPKDFAHAAMMESKSLSGSTKSSYLKLEGARMIIRHESAVDDSKQGARGRNVKKIMIENTEGERFLMPSTNLMAGRAMARHVSKGNHWSDEIGTKISEMARTQKHLKLCASYCRKNKNKLDEDAGQIVEACQGRARSIRETFEGLYRNYDKKCEELLKEPETVLNEDDENTLNERVETLRKKLQLEDESVMDRSACESVARVLESVPGETQDNEVQGDMQALPALDTEVEKDGWESLKSGMLSVSSEVSFPEGADDTARLKVIADAVTHPALAAMLKSVAEKIEAGDASTLLTKIAKSALEATLDTAAGAQAPAVDVAGDTSADEVSDETPDVVDEETMIPLPMLGGVKVEAKAWEDLKQGKMSISKPLSFPIPSTSTNKTVSQLHAVASVCAYHGLSDVLERVADDFDLGRAQPIHKQIADKAIKACIAASKAVGDQTGKDVALAEGIIVTESVREFSNWLDGFKPEMMFNESLYDSPWPSDSSSMSDDQYAGHVDSAVMDAVNDFNAGEFLVTNGEDFGYGDLDMEITDDEVLRSITNYLAQQAETHLSGNVYAADHDFGDLTPHAKDLLPQVLSQLGAEGYTVATTFEETDDLATDAEKDVEAGADGLDSNTEILLGGLEDDISPEDVLIPTNPQTDFENEVTVDHEDDEINRILALAGRRRSEQPDDRPVRP